MRCGPLLATRAINNGFGLPLMWTQERSLVALLVVVIVKAPKASGTHCRQFIVSVRSAIQISGNHMKKFSPIKGIKPLAKIVEKRAILKDSIVP